jgi:hypothetical protein
MLTKCAFEASMVICQLLILTKKFTLHIFAFFLDGSGVYAHGFALA